jgi:uncharacterized protein (DUF362 family)
VKSNRRNFLASAGALTAANATWAVTPWTSAKVFIGKADDYTQPLADLIRRGLNEIDFGKDQVHNKCVLLKPNLVEPTRKSPHINTHPLVIQAAAEVFLRLGAKEVLVAEGQGHVRDTAHVLTESGLGPVLRDAQLEFVDLNHDDVYSRSNSLGTTGLKELFFPMTLKRPDIIVSMPKMKLHHWAGVTLAMKNLFGIMPGIYYGWPKNVLHHHGIERSILDINATVRPQLAIVDGIIGMEGDGPIMGTPKKAGVLVIGNNPAAVDATCSRIMGVDPRNIAYLSVRETEVIGPTDPQLIAQRGESIQNVQTKFQYPRHPHFRQFERW